MSTRRISQLSDLFGWATVALLGGAMIVGYHRDPWFTPVLIALAVGGIVTLVAPAVRHHRSVSRRQGALPDLSDIDALHADPGSGVWRLSPPCGYTWNLYAPGTGVIDPATGFIEGEPTAHREPVGEAYDPAKDGDEPQTLEQLRTWVVPWVEQVSGGRVVEFIEGWGAPYGPNRDLLEWALFAEVAPYEDSPAAQSSSSSREPQPNA